MLYLVIQDIIFMQQCFLFLITNSILMGSSFLDTNFTMLDIGDFTITLHYADYMLTTSLTHDSI